MADLSDALDRLEQLRLLGLGQLPEPEPPVGEDLSAFDWMLAHIESNREYVDRFCREMAEIDIPEFQPIEIPEFRVVMPDFKSIELPEFRVEPVEFKPMGPPFQETN
jgi:hypothetical protein